jgi:hypothetical protein
VGLFVTDYSHINFGFFETFLHFSLPKFSKHIKMI